MLASLSRWGASVRWWMHKGCYRTEPYGAFSHVLPCPSHVICSAVLDSDNTPFCNPVLTDFSDLSPAPHGGASTPAAKK